MTFYRSRARSAVVPIVPMIDILVTILFFVIIKLSDSEEKKPQDEMQVNLPAAGSIPIQTVEISRSTLSLGKNGEAELDGLSVPTGLLKKFLVANLQERPGRKLALRVDKNCPWEVVLAAHSAALEAGYPKEDIYYPVQKPEAGDQPTDL